MFTPSRLTLARQREGLTKVQLADKADITVKSITEYEFGKTEPLPDTVQRLAKVLRYPVSFFEAPDLRKLSPEETTFRALSKLSAIKRKKALAAGTFALEFHRWASELFRLPSVNVPSHQGENPEKAAAILRAEWGLGEKPVANMIHVLEAHGVRVFSLEEDYKEVDAFSTWDDGIPFVFLNTFKTAERSRMDAAHELGHLVLHRHGLTTLDRSIEEEAKQFASAFLMPKSGLLAVVPPFPSLDQLLHLKKRWKVSLAALTFRLHELGAITDWHYRTLCIDIARHGYRRDEPNTIPREKSQIMQKVVNTLRDEGTSVVDVARELHLPVRELSAFLSGFATLPVTMVNNDPSQEAEKMTARPKLVVHKGGAGA